jgi:hypothetical protein
MAAH